MQVLEAVLQSKLNLPLGKRQIGNRSCGTRPVVNERIRLSKVRMIQHVEEFRPELELLFVHYREFLADRGIQNALTGADQDVASGVSICKVSRNREGVDVEPLVRRTLPRWRTKSGSPPQSPAPTRVLRECSLHETAEALGISVAAAKVRLFHARAALRRTAKRKAAAP